MIKGFYLLILGFLSLALSGCNIQRNLLYYPGNANFSDIERYASANGLKMWPDSSASYRGIVSRRGPANFKGTIIVFHGNGGQPSFVLHILPHYRKGVTVLCWLNIRVMEAGSAN